MSPNAPTLHETQVNKKKLLHLASDCKQGGAERVFANTIAQTCTFYDVYVASCDDKSDIYALCENKGIKAFCKLDDWKSYVKPIGAIKFIFNTKNYITLKSFLFTHKPDIIHVQNYLSSLSPSVLYALKAYKKSYPQIRLIYTQHGYGACANGGLYNYATKRICEECIGRYKWRIAYKNCDRRGRIYSILKGIRAFVYQVGFCTEKTLFDSIICVGAFQLQKHKQDKWDSAKLKLLYNPIDSRFYNPAINIESKQNRIIFYGRISAEKNVPLLITAFARLISIKHFGDYHLLIIGDGDDKAHCRTLAQNLLPQHSYTFLSRQDTESLKRILSTAKIAVLPSLLYETFGLTIIESLLAGAIPLVSRHGALEEITNTFGGENFVFCNDFAKDTLHLCEAIAQILTHFDEYFAKAHSQRLRILSLKDAYIKGLIKIYEECT